MPSMTSSRAAIASLCIFSGLSLPSLTGCSGPQKGGPNVQSIALPPGYTVNDRGQAVLDERVPKAKAIEGVELAKQQLLISAAVLDTALDESNSERLGDYQDRFVTQRLLVEALRYRAEKTEGLLKALPEKEEFLTEPLRSDVQSVQSVAAMSASFVSAILERHFPNLRLQDFGRSEVKKIEGVDPTFSSSNGIATVERAALRTMLLTRAQGASRQTSTGIEKKLRDSEFGFYQSALGLLATDLKAERSFPGWLSQEHVFAAAALGQVAAWELNRMQESDPVVSALATKLSPEGAKALMVGGSDSVEGYSRFNRFMQAELPERWNALTPGIKVETYLRLSQRPVSSDTYHGSYAPTVESGIQPTADEQLAYTETRKRFTLQQ
jgi:hypothetical protein